MSPNSILIMSTELILILEALFLRIMIDLEDNISLNIFPKCFPNACTVTPLGLNMQNQYLLDYFDVMSQAKLVLI